MSFPPFSYPTALEGQSIRLLEFKPRDENEPIRLRIIDAALPAEDYRSSEMPVQYLALSYVWGFSDENDPEILLDDIPFTVTPNLSKALAHLENKIDLPIWIDAICINQKDTEEQGRQVKMMDQIYQHAERTIIWLGEGDSSTEKVMNHLQYIGEIAIDAGLNNLGLKAMMEWPDVEADDNHDNNVAIKTKLEALFPKMSRSSHGPFPLQKVFDRSGLPWFQRVWVIQEGCVAKECEFKCGNCKIPGEDFVAAYLFTSMWIGDEVRRLNGSSLFTLPLKLWSMWWRSGWRLAWAFLGILRGKTVMMNTRAMTTMGTRRAWKLMDESNRPTLKQQLCRAFILSSADGLNSTMPKDRIYAFLGISRDAKELDIDPNHYTLSTTEALYRDVARKLVQRGNLDILSLCRTTTSGKINSASITTSVDPRNIALPSWVPDWEAIILPPWGGYKEDGFFHASGPDEVHLTSTNYDNTLILKAR